MASQSIQDITEQISQLSLISFRTIDEVKKLAKHFGYITEHPDTKKAGTLSNYLKNLNQTHRKIFTQKRNGQEVEYIFTTEKKSSLQRQRFNSLPVNEVPELLKNEFLTNEQAKPVHICTDCDVEIELNDEEPLMESLQRHFNLEVHLPKVKRESIDVSEPISLPKMSRRLSAMESGELNPGNLEPILQKTSDKVDRMFLAKLETALVRQLPDNSEASINAAVKFYQEAFEKLCAEVSCTDFAPLTGSVAPIIMSIKDNVNQNFASDANKNFENDDSEDKPHKNTMKKYRYYGPIENNILRLLANHKLLTLVDDRTGKPAFFCMACEYYTLRFRYDSVLSHVFGETHMHNLAYIVQADKQIPFSEELTMETVKKLNQKFLLAHSITYTDSFNCGLCKVAIDSIEACIYHVLDENHLGRLSDKLYRKAKANNPDGMIPDEWGPKSLDWAKFLTATGKSLTNRDHVAIENFIKPLGKTANFCSCCDMTLKGPRQVLFSHVRQKKHLRNAAPFKLALLYKNHCRPCEYYASFGNYYVCAICPGAMCFASFAAAVQHFDSPEHVETIAKLVSSALYPNQDVAEKCGFCDQVLTPYDSAQHILSSVKHQNMAVEKKIAGIKGDIISIYMNGNFILHQDGAMFSCVCGGVFTSIRSLLTHLVYADHLKVKPSTENVFRFYLELKHNINLLARNKYAYYDFGKLKCGVCGVDLEEEENAKRHVVSQRHRENMGASYINVSLDVSGME